MKSLLKQAFKFIGLSGVGWLLDVTVYMLLGIVSANLALNNIISSWVGVSFVFIFSTRYVFQNHSRIPLRSKYVIYLLYQAILIWLISHLLVYIYGVVYNYLALLHLTMLAALTAKILVTPITMVLNFIVMKGLIERL